MYQWQNARPDQRREGEFGRGSAKEPRNEGETGAANVSADKTYTGSKSHPVRFRTVTLAMLRLKSSLSERGRRFQSVLTGRWRNGAKLVLIAASSHPVSRAGSNFGTDSRLTRRCHLSSFR